MGKTHKRNLLIFKDELAICYFATPQRHLNRETKKLIKRSISDGGVIASALLFYVKKEFSKFYSALQGEDDYYEFLRYGSNNVESWHKVTDLKKFTREHHCIVNTIEIN